MFNLSGKNGNEKVTVVNLADPKQLQVHAMQLRLSAQAVPGAWKLISSFDADRCASNWQMLNAVGGMTEMVGAFVTRLVEDPNADAREVWDSLVAQVKSSPVRLSSLVQDNWVDVLDSSATFRHGFGASMALAQALQVSCDGCPHCGECGDEARLDHVIMPWRGAVDNMLNVDTLVFMNYCAALSMELSGMRGDGMLDEAHLETMYQSTRQRLLAMLEEKPEAYQHGLALLEELEGREGGDRTVVLPTLIGFLASSANALQGSAVEMLEQVVMELPYLLKGREG